MPRDWNMKSALRPLYSLHSDFAPRLWSRQRHRAEFGCYHESTCRLHTALLYFLGGLLLNLLLSLSSEIFKTVLCQRVSLTIKYMCLAGWWIILRYRRNNYGMWKTAALIDAFQNLQIQLWNQYIQNLLFFLKLLKYVLHHSLVWQLAFEARIFSAVTFTLGAPIWPRRTLILAHSKDYIEAVMFHLFASAFKVTVQ